MVITGTCSNFHVASKFFQNLMFAISWQSFLKEVPMRIYHPKKLLCSNHTTTFIRKIPTILFHQLILCQRNCSQCYSSSVITDHFRIAFCPLFIMKTSAKPFQKLNEVYLLSSKTSFHFEALALGLRGLSDGNFFENADQIAKITSRISKYPDVFYFCRFRIQENRSKLSKLTDGIFVIFDEKLQKGRVPSFH